MKIVETFEKAVALGAETIVKDSDTEWRCYMPGEIQRPVVEAPPPVPSITAWQIRKALNQMGLREAVEAAVAAGPQDAKDAKRAEINAARDAAVVAPVSALGHVWDADEHSQSLLGKAILLASLGAPLPTVWRDYEGKDLPIMKVDQLLAISGAMAAATQAAYTTAFAKKDALKSATTLEEIEAI